MSSKCKSCGAPIVWATSAKTGKAMPIDVQPSGTGNIVLQVNADPREPPQAIVLAAGADGWMEPERFVSHHSTCPQGKAWKR